MIDLGLVVVSVPDLLRLVAIPVLGWASWRDVRTRRVPNRTWYPLAVLGVALFAWDAWMAYTAGGFDWQMFALRAGISLGFLVPFAYLFWLYGGFGGADAKAIMVVAVLLPTYPEYLLAAPLPDVLGVGTLPAVETAVGVFSFTVLTNAVLLGAIYPVGVTLRNAVAGRIAPVMFVGRPIATDRLAETYGRLLERPDGFTRRGLDLDALRIYLRWRGIDLATLRDDPDRYRDPATLPETPNDPGDGRIVRADGGPTEDDGLAGEATPTDAGSAEDGDGSTPEDDGATEAGSTESEEPPADGDGSAGGAADDCPAGDGAEGEGSTGDAYDDPWGAEAFVADVGEPYGTSAADLRAGLDVVAENDVVWVSPGLPFMVPLFAGLLVAFTYGDLLFGILGLLGLV